MVDVSGRRLDAGLPGRQGRLLFAYLVLNRTRGCPRDELIDVLWPEGPPAAADSALSALLSKLRRALGEGVLIGRGELRVRLEDPVRVDIESARSAILAAEGAMEAGDHALAAQKARDALSTDLQTFLPDAEGGWAAEQRRELETLRLRGLETLAEAGLRQGGRELGAAEQAARAAIAAAPFRESAHRPLVGGPEAAGNPAQAPRAVEDPRPVPRGGRGPTPGPPAATGRAGGDRGGAVPRVRAPAADGGPRGGGQPGRGAARVRGPALVAARGARHDAGARGDDGLRARPARRAAARASRGARRARRAGRRLGAGAVAAAAGGRGRPARPGRTRRRARVPGALLARGQRGPAGPR